MPNLVLLKVSRTHNKIVEPKLLPKNKQTNLFFYPDDSEILDFVRIEKQILHLGEVTAARQFFFEFYWPLVQNCTRLTIEFYLRNQGLFRAIEKMVKSYNSDILSNFYESVLEKINPNLRDKIEKLSQYLHSFFLLVVAVFSMIYIIP